MFNKEKRQYGLFRKTKVYGLVGCIAFGFLFSFSQPVFASDFNRTSSGSVNTSSSGVKPLVADDKVKVVPNGETNFNATVALTTEAGLGSGTLINEDTIVTVAHNFVHLNTKVNPITVENNVNKSGDVHIATLPNGKQVRFSNDDVKFWNRDGYVQGFKNDLAVIKLRNKFTGETPATVSNTVAALKANDTIHVFGFPKGKLQPILNGKVESVENYGANIMGVAYQGSAPGMSGGGLYNTQGELIGVHQNGVEGLRAGGISFSKEQLDWVNAIARGENAQPVYLKDELRNDDKDKDKKIDHGKLMEVDDQNGFGWIGKLYEDGTYVMKGVSGKNVELNNPNGGLQSMFNNDSSKVDKIKRIEVDGILKADLFDLGAYIYPTAIDLTGLTLTDKSSIPFLVYKLDGLTSLTLDKNFRLNSGSSVTRLIDGAPKLNLTNDQVIQLLNNLALTDDRYDGPLLRNVGVERLDLSSFDNSKIDPKKYKEYDSLDESGKRFETKAVFKDLIGLKEIVFGDKFDFEKYGRKNTKDAFLDTDLSGVMRVTLVGKKPGNDKFIKDWVNEAKTKFTRTDLGEVTLLKDGSFVSTVNDVMDFNEYVYPDGVYTLGYSRTETEVVKHGYNYVGDSSLSFKTKVLQIEGRDGERSVTYVYTVSPTGEVSTKPIRVADEDYVGLMLDGEYLVGNQSKETHEIDVAVRYVSDDSKLVNEQEVVKQGSKGLRTIITTYSVNSETGDLYDPVVTEENKPMIERIIKIGTKSTIKEQIVEYRKTKYQANSELDVDDRILQEGSDKIKKTTTKYVLKNEFTELPTVENGGIEVVTSVEYTELQDKIIEKRVPKDIQKEEVFAPKVIYQKDNTREKGQSDIRVEGDAGKKVTPIKYDVNPDTGEVVQVSGEPVIMPARDTIIKVAAKTRIQYLANGDDIIKETTDYSVNSDTGEITENVSREVTNQGGAKKLVEVTKIPLHKKYMKDDTREKGQSDVIEKGQDGKLVYEFPMIVDENTGDVTKGKGVLVKDTKSIDTIVRVAAKDKVVIEEIEPSVVYERDDTRDFGTLNEDIKGELGKKVTTIEYFVNEKTGEVTEVVKDPVFTPAGVTRVQVGTKKRVEMIRKGGNVIERLTEYELDSKTGKVTEKATEKLVSSNGDEQPPVLDIPEYKYVLSGNGLDDDGNQIQSPVVDILEHTGALSANGLDENGNVIEPPVLNISDFHGGVVPNEFAITDVPEYTGRIGMNGEPEVHEKPEYNIPEEQHKVEQSKKELPSVTQKQLPNTGDASMFVSTTGVVFMGIGALSRPKFMGIRALTRLKLKK